MHMADSLHRKEETNTNYKAIILKKKKKVVNYHYLPVRMASSRTMITLNAGEDLGQQEFLFIADEKAKWYSLTERKFGSFLHN